MEQKKLGRKSRYKQDMEYKTVYIPTKFVKMTEDLQHKKKLSSFNQALNMVFAATDKKLVKFITDKWDLIVEALEKNKQSLEGIKEISSVGKLISNFDFEEEALILINEFIDKKFPRKNEERDEQIKILDTKIQSSKDFFDELVRKGQAIDPSNENDPLTALQNNIKRTEAERDAVVKQLSDLAKPIPEEEAQQLSEKASKEFPFWLAQKGKTIKNQKYIKFLIYQKLRE